MQGHVDETGICTNVKEDGGSWVFSFEYSKDRKNITIEKGSITINGVSLTVVDSGIRSFSVAIIPYTYKNTNFHMISKGSIVNLEFDIIGILDTVLPFMSYIIILSPFSKIFSTLI